MSDLPEFVSEAQEIVEEFSRQLLEIEGALREERPYDPDALNASFRAVHTLKGLASLSGVSEIGLIQSSAGDLSRQLETRKDRPRARRSRSPVRVGDLFGMAIARVVDPKEFPELELTGFLGRLEEAVSAKEKPAPERREVVSDPLQWLDESVLES